MLDRRAQQSNGLHCRHFMTWELVAECENIVHAGFHGSGAAGVRWRAAHAGWIWRGPHGGVVQQNTSSLILRCTEQNGHRMNALCCLSASMPTTLGVGAARATAWVAEEAFLAGTPAAAATPA